MHHIGKREKMSIGNALGFIKRGLHDHDLRDRLNRAESAKALREVMTEEGMIFSVHEFENAVNSLLVKCRHIEHASQLKEFQMWWEMLQSITGVQMCQKNCGGTCG